MKLALMKMDEDKASHLDEIPIEIYRVIRQ